MRKFGLMLWIFMWSIFAGAQEGALTADNVRLERRLDAFGVEVQVITGEVRNNSRRDAFININIFADLVTDEGDVIGEGFGFLVDACGTALLDTALQPGQSQQFLTNVDLFAEGDIDDIEIIVEGAAAAATPAAENEYTGVTQVTDEEVVAVEWLDESTLRYGVGCDSRVFSGYDWYRYDLARERSAALQEHPNSLLITDAFLRQTGINQLTQSREDDLTLFDRSFLTVPVQTERIVYQTDIHTLVSAEHDGSFKRIIHQLLHSYSLQGFNWTPLGNFVAYYYGAYDDPVRYFTASANQGLIGAVITVNTSSVTVPGIVNDARRVIIGGEFPNADGESVTGYWLSSVITQQRELLFEVDVLPGNNYPAPAYYRVDDRTRYIYVIRPINGQPTLQCYFREGNELRTLTRLPLQLETDERAWSWLSPDFNTLALAANGRHSGLWLVDLSVFGGCGG